MLRIVTGFSDLDFGALAAVYAGSTGGSLQAEQELYGYLRQGFFTQPEDCCCLWEQEGKPVSALRLQAYKDGLLLEALETAPEFRRKGYAKALTLSVLAGFPGRRLYVHIEHRNTASVALHLACGFRKLSDMARYADGSVTSRAGTYLYEK